MAGGGGMKRKRENVQENKKDKRVKERQGAIKRPKGYTRSKCWHIVLGGGGYHFHKKREEIWFSG
jgi:hypothetical protein